MRAALLFVVAAIQVDIAKQYIEDQLSNVDLDCFQDKCKNEAADCSTGDAGCAKRMACLSDHSKAHEAEHCFFGATLETISPLEQKVLECARANQCVTLSPSAASLVQDSSDAQEMLKAGSDLFVGTAVKFGNEVPQMDDEYQSDVKELDDAEAKLKAFTKHTREKLGDIEEKTKKMQHPDVADDDDDDSSLIQTTVHADGTTTTEKVDPVDHLLHGIEGLISKMQVAHGFPSFAQLSDKVGPIDQLQHMDDTTMIVALGALTSAMGAQDQATSFLQSGDTPIAKAYELGMAMGQTPEFLQTMFAKAGVAHQPEAERDLRTHD
jgi:hypothetical protein